MKKEKITKNKEENKIKAIITSRVLFISVLDKIYLIILALCLLMGTFSIFNGPIGNLNYAFFARVGKEIIFLIVLFIIYLLMNWFYKCASKTMLCLTKNEVYKELYIPFKRSETSIPLNKITGVSTINLFWIFRTIIIHQYNKLPLVFFTWTNQEFKDELNLLINNEKEHVENEFTSRNIITMKMLNIIKYVGLGLVTIIAILGIVRFFTYVFNKERSLAGIYRNENYKLELKKNGNCALEGFTNDATTCTWSYSKDTNEVKVNYEYNYNYIYYKGTNKDTLTLKLNLDDKTLEYRSVKLSK